MMTIVEFAKVFRISRRTMEGVLKKHPVGFKVGNRWRFEDADIARLRAALEEADPRRRAASPEGLSGTMSPDAALRRVRALLGRRRSER